MRARKKSHLKHHFKGWGLEMALLLRGCSSRTHMVLPNSSSMGSATSSGIYTCRFEKKKKNIHTYKNNAKKLA